MKRKLDVNENSYLLLEFLNMLDYFNFDEDIKNKIIKLRLYLYDQIYSKFLEQAHHRDIIDIKHTLEFTFK